MPVVPLTPSAAGSSLKAQSLLPRKRRLSSQAGWPWSLAAEGEASGKTKFVAKIPAVCGRNSIPQCPAATSFAEESWNPATCPRPTRVCVLFRSGGQLRKVLLQKEDISVGIRAQLGVCWLEGSSAVRMWKSAKRRLLSPLTQVSTTRMSGRGFGLGGLDIRTLLALSVLARVWVLKPPWLTCLSIRCSMRSCISRFSASR